MIGIVGGTGLYGLEGLSEQQWVRVESPFGAPSDELLFGRLGEHRVVFLPRHGRGHRIPPHEINFQANIFAVLGIRSLYFVLAGMAKRFVYLQPGLAMVLIFVGAKLAASHFLHIPVVVSLFIVSLLLGGSIIASLRKQAADRRHGDPA